MAKTRLKVDSREALKELAKRKVTESYKEKLDSIRQTEKQLAQDMQTHIYTMIDKKELDTLLKHGFAKDSGRVHIYNMKGDDCVSWRYHDLAYPIRQKGQYSKSVKLQANTKLAKQFEKYHADCKAIKDDITSDVSNYEVVIDSARYYEDVVDVWSEAVELEGDIKKPTNSLSLVSKDIIKQIQNDVAKREKKT